LFAQGFWQFFHCPPTQCPPGQGRGLLSKKWTGMDRGREGVENCPKCPDICYG